MDSDRADPDTQVDVDILILDYLTCIGIDMVIYVKTVKREGNELDRNVAWQLNSVNMIHSRLENQNLPQDLKTKLQILHFAQLLLHPSTYLEPIPSAPDSAPTSRETEDQTPQDHTHNTHTTIVEAAQKFIALCRTASEKVSDTRCASITALFVLHAVIEEYRITGKMSSKPFNEYIEWTPHNPKQALKWSQECTKYNGYLQPPSGRSLKDHVEFVSTEMPLLHLEQEVIAFVTDLMNTLDPPVLLQLERGKLDGLTRLETQELKDRVGLQ